MTGFTRQEWHHETGSYCWEIRAVNHRFLELSFRLPEPLRELEAELRDIVRQTIARGKIDCILHFHSSESAHPPVKLHHGLLQQLIATQTEIASMVAHTTPVDTMQLMRWPGVLVVGDINLQQVKPFLLQAFTQAVQGLLRDRAREGAALRETLIARLAQMTTFTQRLQAITPQLMLHQQQKLLNKVRQLAQEVDAARLAQEVALLAQRADIAEEVERLTTHMQEMQNILANGGSVGRRLDFLLQEMHREVNTLGAKATDLELTQLAVELKVLIEQMREQVQNIE
jgi:uncharacterized protein (TIGR00255 family)